MLNLSNLDDFKAFCSALGKIPPDLFDEVCRLHQEKDVKLAIEEVLNSWVLHIEGPSIDKIIKAWATINKTVANKLSIQYLGVPYSSRSKSSEVTVTKKDDIYKLIDNLETDFAYLVTELQEALVKESNLDRLIRLTSNRFDIDIDIDIDRDPSESQRKAIIKTLFRNLKKYYSYMSYDVLTFLSRQFVYEAMHETMKDYDRQLNEFLESTTVGQFQATVEEALMRTPGQCCVTIILENKWSDCTLKNLRTLLEYLFQKKKAHFQRLKISNGSVKIQLLAPASIMVSLITLASKKHKEMSYLGILSIQVGTEYNICLRSASTFSTFESSLNEAIKVSHKGNLSLVKCLLEIGADPNSEDDLANTPLINAAIKNDVEAMKLLVAHKADPFMFNTKQVSVIHIAASLHLNLCYEGVKYLLEEAGIPPDYHDPVTKNTPLIAAASSNNVKTIELLLEKKANIDFQETDGYSALTNACMTNSIDAAKILLKAKAKPDLKTNKSRVLRTQEGCTALYFACNSGYEDIVRLLLEHNANPNVRSEGDGMTPLMFACNLKYYNIVKLLLQAGAHVNTQSNISIGQITALYIAAYNNDSGLVSLLLKADANVNTCDTEGITPLFYACFHGNEEMVIRLLKAKAKPNLCNKSGISPLHVAIQCNCNVRIIEELLLAEADPNSLANGSKSPLHIACDSGNEDVIKLLLAAKTINIEVLDSNGHTPLCVATIRGHTKIVELLLEAGANPELQADKRKWTPIFFAAGGGHTEILDLLLKYKATVARDTFGVTLLDAATTMGHTKVHQILSEHLKTEELEETKDVTIRKEGPLSAIKSYFKRMLDSFNKYHKATIEPIGSKIDSLKAAFKPSFNEPLI